VWDGQSGVPHRKGLGCLGGAARRGWRSQGVFGRKRVFPGGVRGGRRGGLGNEDRAMQTELGGQGPHAQRGSESPGLGQPLLPNADDGAQRVKDGGGGGGGGGGSGAKGHTSPATPRRSGEYVCHICLSTIPEEDAMWLHMVQAHVDGTQRAHKPLPPLVVGPLGEMMDLQFRDLALAASSNLKDQVNAMALSKMAQLAALGGGMAWMLPGWEWPSHQTALPGVPGEGVLPSLEGERRVPFPYDLAAPGPVAQPPLRMQMPMQMQTQMPMQMPMQMQSAMLPASPQVLSMFGTGGRDTGMATVSVAGTGMNAGLVADARRILIPAQATTLRRKERRFWCPACPRNYASRSGLWMHTRSVHHGLRHVCEYCHREFPFQSGLISHTCTRSPLDAGARGAGTPKRRQVFQAQSGARRTGGPPGLARGGGADHATTTATQVNMEEDP